MARTPGATNRTPRELKKEGERLIEKAKLKEKLQKAKTQKARK